ncbi:MAG: dipeptidase [Actinomycetota bacterium]|nr:dipeptidase [Actinomycetota bacterium]
MIADLHAHYPMHLMPPGAGSAHDALRARRRRARWRARLLDAFSRLANYQGPAGGPGVTVDLMRRGRVGVVLSVLYSPFAEMDLSKHYAAAPEDGYFRDVQEQLDLVERDIGDNESAFARVVHGPTELSEALRDGKVALVHCLEGGFHLGESEAAVRANVAELARRGVAYVTLAHLFWRRVATNTPALPVPEWAYRLVFRQPGGEGLSERGAVALDAMVEHGILVDIAHMSQASLDDTFRLLDERDPGRRVPVIASHGACRFGRRTYNLSSQTIERVAERGGVVGISASERHLTDGLRSGTRSFADSVDVVCAHVDRIREISGSFDHAALGSDLDGYIKPAVHGLEHMGRMAALEDALGERYGEADAAKVCSGNALRLLERHWLAPAGSR